MSASARGASCCLTPFWRRPGTWAATIQLRPLTSTARISVRSWFSPLLAVTWECWVMVALPEMVARSLPRQQPVPHRIYVKVKGRWTCLYRAVDSRGQTIDFLLSAKRDAAAARRFFRKALGQPHTVNPRTLTVDKNAAYPAAVTAMKRNRELWRFSRLRQVKYLNNIVEQDHRRIKRLVRPGLGFGSLQTARRTLAGYEGMAMIRKGQVRNMGGG